MKHIELIELIYKHRDLIDDAFKGEKIKHLPSELIDDVAVFQKVAKQYELSDSYTQFANAMLKRVDANYTFGDYNEEIKLLMKRKSDFLISGEKEILQRIKELVRILYKKIEQRDILINARVNDIVNDNELSIELIIKDARDVNERIEELIEAHAENIKVLGKELRGLDEELDEMLVDIGLDMLPFSENIHLYIKRLSDFILRTEKRKLQNKKISSLFNKISKEADYELKALLLSNHQIYMHTVKERKTGLVKHVPSKMELKKTSFLNLLSCTLKIKKTERRAIVDRPYQVSKTSELKAIRLELIQQDALRDKPQDLYSYILGHAELDKFKEDKLDKSYAFKVYLTVVQNNRENIVLMDEKYNNNNIKVAKWI
ncbi:hypothetical protein [Sulfurimonas sp.]|uniref:hypothetical protein n=1 Tax=Sulfurimonas sp. TaxID=2022749 RepID=UPI0025F71FD3|nr:hypothetical protein [Sulfurimonas sp.]